MMQQQRRGTTAAEGEQGESGTRADKTEGDNNKTMCVKTVINTVFIAILPFTVFSGLLCVLVLIRAPFVPPRSQDALTMSWRVVGVLVLRLLCGRRVVAAWSPCCCCVVAVLLPRSRRVVDGLPRSCTW